VVLDARINAVGLLPGSYRGAVRIQGNDPATPSRDVGARLVVIGGPDIRIAPRRLDFGSVFAGDSASRTFYVSNIGTDTLHVASITSPDSAYVARRGAFRVAPRGVDSVRVAFHPRATRLYAVSLTVSSDDLDSTTVAVAVSGSGVIPPAIEVGGPIAAALANGIVPEAALETRPLVISNLGGT